MSKSKRIIMVRAVVLMQTLWRMRLMGQTRAG